MTTTDLKGHLIAKINNLEGEEARFSTELLRAEERVKSIRCALAATQGAIQHVREIIALVDSATAPANVAKG